MRENNFLKRSGYRLNASLILAVACFSLHAQVQIPPSADPGVIQNREVEREQRQRLDEQRNERIEQPLRPAARPALPVQADNATSFEVRDIRFDPGSEILSTQELQDITVDYRGSAITLTKLRELVGRINALYQAKGVVTAQASLPSQDVTEGVVHIRLIEGRVGNIRVEGNASTRENFVTDRLTQQPGTLVDLGVLERDLLRFNRSNDAQLRVDLKPGADLGKTDINLTVVEPKVDDLRLFGDNAGSSATGVARLGVSYTRRSLTGQRDDVYLSLVRSGGNTGRSVSYGMPVTRWGTRATLSYNSDDTRIIDGPIAALDITGQATGWTLSVRHPLKVSTDVQIDALATMKQRHTANWISGVELTAAELAGGTLGLDAQLLGSQSNLNITAEVSSGTNRPEGSDARDYTLMRGAVRHSRSFDTAWTLNSSFSWQYAELKLLPSSEQIQIGGEGSVRGFEPGVFSGDQGWTLNLELQRQLKLESDAGWTGALVAFVDYGEVQPFRPLNNSRGVDTLTSAGLGLSFALRERAQARLTFAKPMNPPIEVSDATRAHFQATWFF